MKKFLCPLVLLFLSSAFAKAQTYPPNIFADSAFAPFFYGVASGDPTTDGFILWTKIETTEDVGLLWQVSTDSSFSVLEMQGVVVALSKNDYTAKANVVGLKAGAKYFYRFVTPLGKFSRVGKAQTLPDNSVTQFKLAVVSCSSIWAGFFNAYRIIAERVDIDFLIHLGDYVYDYPDDRQYNRMPSDTVKDCAGLNDWRTRHKYYLLDPDLRLARQNKTWIAEWDNHDTDVEEPGKTEEAIQAFYEYLPIRMPDTLHPENIYRSFKFGTLADLNMVDMHLFRGKEEYEPGKKSVLGLQQDAWLKNNLLNSRTQWHLIGNQEMMTDWLSSKTVQKITHRGNGKLFDTSNWNGFPDDRNRFYQFLDDNRLNNIVVLTGDIHMSFVIDMTASPKDKKIYSKRTGAGAVGVEITGPSISRVNMMEAGVPAGFIPAAQNISRSLNPHHRWCQFSKHGYFTLDVTPEKCTAEFWFVPIKEITIEEKPGKKFSVLSGENHWQR